jgi:hypothetical protein
MYLRFVTENRLEHDGRREGIFQAAAEFVANLDKSVDLAISIQAHLRWFSNNLSTPPRFNRTKSKGHYRRETAGLSWFKSGAIEHVDRARMLALLLAEAGYEVRLLKTSRPGFIVYEDDHQIVAEPFADTPI